MKIYCYTSFSFSVSFYTEESKPYKVYPYTSKDKTVYAYTEPSKLFKSYFYTNKLPTVYFYTEPRFNGEDPFYSDNDCKYPSELELIRQKAILEYYKQVKSPLFLSINKICFIDGCSLTATTIEHTKGRTGYADEWARENKISLFLDERFWKGCCWKHNGELENNTELSHKYQLSKIHNGTKGELK